MNRILLFVVILLGFYTYAQQRVPVNLTVIGLGVDSATEAQLQAIAQAGKGRYINASNEAELNQALGEALGVTSPNLVQEVEANNSLGLATPIAASSSITGSIDPLRDHDWYRFEVNNQGLLNLQLTNPSNLDMAFRLFSPDAGDLTGWRVSPTMGGLFEAQLDLKEPGIYYLEFADSGDNANTAEAYNFTLTFLPGDNLEPSNSFGQAISLSATQSIEASINPHQDHDWYRFTVDRQGLLELLITQVPEELDIAFRLFSPDARDLTGWQVPPRPGGDNQVRLHLPEPGTYHLELADSGDNASSALNYLLDLNYFAGDDFEANNSFGKAYPLTFGQDIQASINPKGDHDWYSFEVNQQGLLNLLITDSPPDLDIAFRLFSPDTGDLTGWQQARALGGDNDAILNLEQAGQYYLEVADGGDNASSADFYRLSLQFDPGDSFEPNNSLGKAKSIGLGQEILASINPRRDHDWYRFSVTQPGTLSLLITNSPANVDVAFRLFSPDARDLTGWRNARSEGGDNDASLSLDQPGTYYLELADGGDNASSPASYTLRISIAP